MLAMEEVLCELSREDINEQGLPPGFRFHPTDEELITFYLASKVFNGSFCGVEIAEVDLNRCEPWELPGMPRVCFMSTLRQDENGERQIYENIPLSFYLLFLSLFLLGFDGLMGLSLAYSLTLTHSHPTCKPFCSSLFFFFNSKSTNVVGLYDLLVNIKDNYIIFTSPCDLGYVGGGTGTLRNNIKWLFSLFFSCLMSLHRL